MDKKALGKLRGLKGEIRRRVGNYIAVSVYATTPSKISVTKIMISIDSYLIVEFVKCRSLS